MRNEGYEASLERNKIYAVLPDAEAERDGDLRVIDESGEDYLFSADRFVAIEVPAAVKASLSKAAQGWGCPVRRPGFEDYALDVAAVTFRWESGHAFEVAVEDYH